MLKFHFNLQIEPPATSNCSLCIQTLKFHNSPQYENPVTSNCLFIIYRINFHIPVKSSIQQPFILCYNVKIPPQSKIQSPKTKKNSRRSRSFKFLNQLLHSSVFQDWLLLSWVKIRYPGFRVKVFTIIAGFRHRQKGHWFYNFSTGFGFCWSFIWAIIAVFGSIGFDIGFWFLPSSLFTA